MNPVAIAIPCHRVVRTNGETGNYFYGTEMKESLLRMERDH
jgi:O-6-methylguanine DNA methyltransferase